MQTQEAIVLKVIPYSDSSSILSVFFKTYGLCDVIVKNSKLSFSPLLKVEMSFISSEKSLWKATLTHIQKSYTSSLKSFDHIQKAFLIKEFLLKALPKCAPAKKQYELFLNFLDSLKMTSCSSLSASSFLEGWCTLEGITREHILEFSRNENPKFKFEEFFRFVCDYEGVKMNAKGGT